MRPGGALNREPASRLKGTRTGRAPPEWLSFYTKEFSVSLSLWVMSREQSRAVFCRP